MHTGAAESGGNFTGAGEKVGSVLGICVDATEEETKKIAKTILEKKGIKYKNLSIEKGSEAEKYLRSVMTFSTTLLLDREGDIIGEPIVGSIRRKEPMRCCGAWTPSFRRNRRPCRRRQNEHSGKTCKLC